MTGGMSDVAHKLAMLAIYRRWLAVKEQPVPAILDRWEAEAHLEAAKRHDAPQGDIDRDAGQAGLHQRLFLTRHDVAAITGASVRTVDRWVTTGDLRSTKRGRVRRIARSDLDEFLTAA